MTFDELCVMEPRLRELEAEARALAPRVRRKDPYAAWYGYGPYSGRGLKNRGVIVSAAGAPGDWYAAGKCFAHGSEVCVFGTPTDAELADMARVLTPAEAVAWVGTIPHRAPHGWRKTGLPSMPAAVR